MDTAEEGKRRRPRPCTGSRVRARPAPRPRNSRQAAGPGRRGWGRLPLGRGRAMTAMRPTPEAVYPPRSARGAAGRGGKRKVTPRRPPPFPARAHGGRGPAGVEGFGPRESGPAWPPCPLRPLSPGGTRSGRCSKYGGVLHALPPPGFVFLVVVSPFAAVQALPP